MRRSKKVEASSEQLATVMFR